MSDTRVRVLVVDDDEVSREVLSLVLEDAGYAVETIDSGDGALLLLKDVSHALPGVVLVDMQMPGTGGSNLARQLRGACDAGTLLLAMSGSRPEGDAALAYDAFLLKPFSVEQFAGAVAGGSFAASRGESAGVLNDSIYRKLADSMPPSKLEKLYAMCLNDAEKRIAEMRRTAARQDDATYRREAHAVKGGCGMVGATELQTLASTMESNGIEANHVASLDEFLLASKRLRRILVARNRR
jgi:CheY-like chemotaxis protein